MELDKRVIKRDRCLKTTRDSAVKAAKQSLVPHLGTKSKALMLIFLMKRGRSSQTLFVAQKTQVLLTKHYVLNVEVTGPFLTCVDFFSHRRKHSHGVTWITCQRRDGMCRKASHEWAVVIESQYDERRNKNLREITKECGLLVMSPSALDDELWLMRCLPNKPRYNY